MITSLIARVPHRRLMISPMMRPLGRQGMSRQQVLGIVRPLRSFAIRMAFYVLAHLQVRVTLTLDAALACTLRADLLPPASDYCLATLSYDSHPRPPPQARHEPLGPAQPSRSLSGMMYTRV